MNNLYSKLCTLLLIIPLTYSCRPISVKPLEPEQIRMEGDLRSRIEKNFDRLEEEKYRPENVFLTEAQSGGWPGDTEGRTILGLIKDSRASGRCPIYLQEIMHLIPSHLNEKGYMGIIYPGKMNEQQLSGNGWMLRSLCEYYEWKNDPKILSLISTIADSLFVTGKGFYARYPIDPQKRIPGKGAESGNTIQSEGEWMLSTDIGCLFIGMDGAIQAYKYHRTPQLKAVINEMIERFLEIDLIGIRAQTHATLTACRGLIRYAEITGEDRYVEEAEKRWKLYLSDGMTENFENYNWFDRFDTWSEPCAIVDSYLLAVQLWQHTGKKNYKEIAEYIYYNALSHTQRWNGGFGCDNCPGKMSGNTLRVHADEAHWCCTMRGGEGLGSAANFACFQRLRTLLIPFYQTCVFEANIGEGIVSITEESSYPFEGRVSFFFSGNTAGNITIKLSAPSWTKKHQLFFNNEFIPCEVNNGFITLSHDFVSGDKVELLFDQTLSFSKGLNKQNTDSSVVRIFYGPLLLGYEGNEEQQLDLNDSVEKLEDGSFQIKGKEIPLSPIYHLMDRKVWSDSGYHKQILFHTKKKK